MNDEKKKLLIAELEEIMELDAGELSESTDLEELDEWDSLAVVSTMAMVDEEFGVMVEAEKLSKVKTVSELIALIDAG